MELIFWAWMFTLMVFFHVIEDFHIQGILAQLKQRTWWYNQPDFSSRYKYDYIIAMLIHGFEWSFFVHIPLFYYIGVSPIILISLGINAILHAYIDHLKCNARQLNLAQDQILHIFQIFFIISYMFIIYR